MKKAEGYSPINHRDESYAEYARSIRFPTPKQKRVNTVRFLWGLRNQKNPDTGSLYTLDDMARIMGYTRKSFNNALLEAGIVRYPAPEVRSDKVPDNEVAFFKGLSHGNFESRELVWGTKRLVAVETATKKATRRNALIATLGTWGEVHEGSSTMSIYLDPDNFSFLLNGQNDTDTPESVETFAPFLLGLMTMRMSEKEGRVSSQNGDLIHGIAKSYREHFGVSLGYCFQEQRVDQMGPTYTVQIRDNSQVYSNLLQVPGVRALPFLNSITSKNGSSQTLG